MQYFIVILAICFIVFLFTIYAFCKDDFVLFRKNVDMEKVFNVAFMTSFMGLFFARLFYVLLYFKPLYLNPLAFLLFPYFPGLSLPGGLLGASLALVMLLEGKKYPGGRIFDFFVVAFLAATCTGALVLCGFDFTTTRKLPVLLIIQSIIVLILFVFSLHATRSHRLKEGSTGITALLFLSIFFLGSFWVERPWDILHLIKESSMWIVSFIVASIFLLRQDSFSVLYRFFRGR